MASLVQDIKNGNLKSLYLFYGEEAFKRRYYKNLLKQYAAVFRGAKAGDRREFREIPDRNRKHGSFRPVGEDP